MTPCPAAIVAAITPADDRPETAARPRAAIALKRAALARVAAGLSLAARLQQVEERLQRGDGDLDAGIRRRLDGHRRELVQVVAGLNLASHPARLVERKSRDLDNVAGSLRRVMALDLGAWRADLRELAHRFDNLRWERMLALSKQQGVRQNVARLLDAGRAALSNSGRRVPDGPLRPAWPLGLTVAAAVLLADQVSKVLLVEFLQGRGFQPLEITSFFRLVMVRNTGIGFGLLAGGHELMRWLLVAFAGLAALALSLWMARPGTGRLQGVALGLVVGGALGNATDRVLHGAVADFFDFHIAGWSWPAFNLADSAIVAGIVVLAGGCLAGNGRRS